MPDRNYGLVLFESTSQALKAEREIKDSGISCAVIPTPVEFTAGCGISLLLDEKAVKEAEQALRGCEGFRVLYPYVRRRSSTEEV